MNPPKNIQFTKLIKAGGRLREFNFRKSSSKSGPIFTVDVADHHDIRHYLIFRKDGDKWFLESKEIALWIEEVIPQIKEAVYASD
jgi:hypothetical protein